MKNPSESSERAQRISECFDELVELSTETRALRISELGRNDPDIQAELKSLLRAYDQADEVLRRLEAPLISPAEPGLDRMIGRTVTHYRIEAKVGGGGMGIVYRAHDTKLGRPVALKFLPPELMRDKSARERFVQEARAASSLDNPNIAVVHEIDETEEGQVFIVTAYYEGETLKQKIERGPLPVEEVNAYALQIAEGLARAHRSGIIHRDVKPANILVTPEGVIKIVDFGLAKLADVTLTRQGTTVGTVAYMSPEQVRGERVDHRTDLWSLGVVLYEMITGERPFKGEHEQVMLHAILHIDPAPVQRLRADVPEPWITVVEKLLKKNPAERYQQAHEVMDDLRTPAASRTPAAVTAVPIKLAKRLRVRAGALVLLLLMAGFLLWQQVSGPSTSSSRAEPQPFASLPSVAVLPLKNNSGDPEQAYFADGMTEALLSELAKIEEIRVISLLQYKEVQKPLPEILKEFAVGLVLEGGVVASDTKVGIAARLTDVRTGEVLWSERFQRELRDVVTLQREVALAIAREIAGTLTPREEQRLSVARTVDEEAFRLYLKGLQVRHQTDNVGYSVPYWEQAVERDPEFAQAWGFIAISYALIGDKARAEQAIEKALALDASLSEAYVAHGLIRQFIDWDLAGAEEAFRRAIEFSPNDSEAHHELGQLLMRLGRFEEALPEMERAFQLNPLAPRFQEGVGEVYFYQKRYDKALEVLEAITEQFPSFANTRAYIGRVYLQRGMTEQAIEHFKRWNRPGQSSGLIGLAYARAGRSAEAWEIHKTLTELPWDQLEGMAPLYLVAIPAALGDRETALEWLEQVYDRRKPALLYFSINPSLDTLRSEPRFQAVMKKIGFE